MFTANSDIRALYTKQRQLSDKLYNYPHDSLHAIISKLLFKYNLVHNWKFNEFSLDFYNHDNANEQYTNWKPHECIRFASAKNRNEYFESGDVCNNKFLILFFPDLHKYKAEIVETNLDLGKLKDIKKMIDTFNNEFPKMVKSTVDAKLSIENEIEMLKTYAEVAGEYSRR